MNSFSPSGTPMGALFHSDNVDPGRKEIRKDVKVETRPVSRGRATTQK
jgi:hypothetical protein